MYADEKRLAQLQLLQASASLRASLGLRSKPCVAQSQSVFCITRLFPKFSKSFPSAPGKTDSRARADHKGRYAQIVTRSVLALRACAPHAASDLSLAVRTYSLCYRCLHADGKDSLNRFLKTSQSGVTQKPGTAQRKALSGRLKVGSTEQIEKRKDNNMLNKIVSILMFSLVCGPLGAFVVASAQQLPPIASLQPVFDLVHSAQSAAPKKPAFDLNNYQ